MYSTYCVLCRLGNVREYSTCVLCRLNHVSVEIVNTKDDIVLANTSGNMLLQQNIIIVNN